MKSEPLFVQAAAELGALAHPARLAILCQLSEQDCCCCRDVVAQFDLAQSTVSQHLKVLVEAGLVRLEAKGQRSRYAIDRAAVEELSRRFGQILHRLGDGKSSTGI